MPHNMTPHSVNCDSVTVKTGGTAGDIGRLPESAGSQTSGHQHLTLQSRQLARTRSGPASRAWATLPQDKPND